MSRDLIERPWRCDITGNPVGTDTRMIGAPPCDCQGCRAADRIAALEAEASEGERKGLERAADFVAARVPTHSARQRQAYEAGRDRLGEVRHAQHCEALAIETMLRALIPEAPVREGE